MNENTVPPTPEQTTLDDARVVTMRELTGLDEYQIEKFMIKDGAKPDGFGMMLYIKFLALQALVSVGDKNYAPATSHGELVARLGEFKSRDLAKILELYNMINGRGKEGNDNS